MIEKLKYYFSGISGNWKHHPNLDDVVDKVNELIDTINELERIINESKTEE